ncbi:hypothetical protein LINPERHAP1_LOCUS25970 [Linum perenne]
MLHYSCGNERWDSGIRKLEMLSSISFCMVTFHTNMLVWLSDSRDSERKTGSFKSYTFIVRLITSQIVLQAKLTPFSVEFQLEWRGM